MELGRYGVTVNAIAPGRADPHDREPRHGRGLDGQEARGVRPAATPATSPRSWCGWAAPSRPTSPAGSSTCSGGHITRGRGLGGRARRVDKGDRWDPAELGTVVQKLVADAAPNATMPRLARG